jgi:predicted nucleic acid-binding protein
MGLMQDCGKGPVGLDTVAFIYFIQEHPRFLSLLRPLFTAVDDGRLRAVTSSITLLEVLVAPYRARDFALASSYELLMTCSRGIEMVAIDNVQLRAAAALRARARLKTPDALQLAASLSRGCTAFVTNDADLRTTADLRILQLGDYVRDGANS